MREVSTSREVVPKSIENGSMYGLLNKSRRLACAALAGGALLLTGCGPDNPNNGTGGQAAEGGMGGTGGVGAMGGGGTGGDNPCEGLEFGGLASKKFEPGETGSFTVNFDESHPDAHFNGMKFEMISGDIVIKPSTVGLTQVIYDNYQTGYGEIGDVSGIRPYVFDPDEHYILDENGNCTLNVVSINQEAMADPARQPVMESPTGIFATVFKFQNESESMVDYSLQVENTRFALGSMTTLDSDTDYIMGNSLPVLSTKVTRDPDGHLLLDLTGTTDEGVSSDLVLGKLNANANGVTFEPVVGQPGKFRTTVPSNLTSLNLSVEGPNQPLTNDTANATVGVSCEGINTNGHGICSEGLVTCDPGFANDDADQTNDCDGCDTESGLYENDYPVCSPDVTPPNAPVITTNGGNNTNINQANFTLEGTTDIDTDEVLLSTDGGGFNKINSYVANNPSWTYNGNIPTVFEWHEYCFAAEDKANNQSTTDCIVVNRVQ